jgi:hypothetical protein
VPGGNCPAACSENNTASKMAVKIRDFILRFCVGDRRSPPQSFPTVYLIPNNQGFNGVLFQETTSNKPLSGCV